jgi:hypothetical protein
MGVYNDGRIKANTRVTRRRLKVVLKQCVDQQDKRLQQCLCDVVGPESESVNCFWLFPRIIRLSPTPPQCLSHPSLGNSERDSGLTFQSPLVLVSHLRMLIGQFESDIYSFVTHVNVDTIGMGII